MSFTTNSPPYVELSLVVLGCSDKPITKFSSNPSDNLCLKVGWKGLKFPTSSTGVFSLIFGISF